MICHQGKRCEKGILSVIVLAIKRNPFSLIIVSYFFLRTSAYSKAAFKTNNVVFTFSSRLV